MKKINLLFSLLLLNVTMITAQNNSLDFDGSDDRVLVNASTALNAGTNSAITVEAWIFADAWRANHWQGTIVGKDQSNQSGYVLRAGNNGALSFTLGNGGGVWTEALSAPVMQINTWHHVAGVMDNGTIRVYIDGVQVATQVSTAMVNSTRPVYIGESSGFFGRVFDGKIDEVRIWNTVRSASDITANMAVDLPSTTPNLIAYFKMDSIAGNTVFNEIGTTSNGTLQNFTGVTNLAGGYFIPTTDLTASSVQSPDMITIFEKDSKVKIDFENTGNDTITTFTAGYILNGGVAVTETINHTLLPGGLFTHTFSQLLPIQNSAMNLKVYGNAIGDLNGVNDTVTLNYQPPSFSGNSVIVPIFSSDQHNFGSAGQNQYAGIVLPDDNLNYGNITLEISVSCPVGGCDPWDQPARISVLKDGQTHEIARYITPYRLACGPWTVDVTDFKTLLKGYTEFASYIQVWGNSGWLLDARLLYDRTPAVNPYQKLTPLWASDNWVYGDPAISYDLPAQTIVVDSNSVEVGMRMTISGHGQGNTNNAAEFSNFTHQVTANGSNVMAHNLWKNNCASNVCANQLGTWTLSRAGWCPGEAVDPLQVNLTNSVMANNNLTVDYVLQNYTNNLRTGYNGGSHTEPHYKVHAYLVEKSNQYIGGAMFTDLAATEITSPTLMTLGSNPSTKVILKNYGSEPISNPQITLMVNGAQSAVETPNITILPGDSLEYIFTTSVNYNSGVGYNLVVVLDVPNDAAVSNDIVSTTLAYPIGIDELLTEENLEIYPNPTKAGFTLKGEQLSGTANIRMFNAQGQVVFQVQTNLNGKYEIKEQFELGIYFVEVELGQMKMIKRVVVL